MSAANRWPVLFIGHGSPMNAIESNRWSTALRELGATLPRLRAIVVISAHWFVPGSWVTAQAEPATLHDFGGFPPALHAMRYPAPGAPQLAAEIAAASATAASARAPTGDWTTAAGACCAICSRRPIYPCCS